MTKPKENSTLSPYLIVEDASELIDFLKNVFNAELMLKIRLPDGTINHCEVKIGDTTLMIGTATPQFTPMKSMIHVYTEDVDKTYQKAIDYGAKSIRKPSDQYFGDRNGGVKGPFGNYWWIATHLEDVSQEEIEKRLAQRQE